MAMIRKQVYIEASHQAKLASLAAEWGCTEAEVVRTALERLPEPDAIRAILIREGLYVPPPPGEILSDEELTRREEEYDAWLETLPGPLGLSEAVIEDRR